MNPKLTTLAFSLAILALSLAAIPAQTQTITEFNVPGAGTGINQGTKGSTINASGVITGEYLDSGSVHHGYVRSAAGAITAFNAPGAGTGLDQGTSGWAINTAGLIGGEFLDSGNVHHGFIRATSGAITTFNAPGAGTGNGQGTHALGLINAAGTLDAPGAGTGNLRKDFRHGTLASVEGDLRRSGRNQLHSQQRQPGNCHCAHHRKNGENSPSPPREA